MQEAFIEMTDQLFWKGYTEQMMEENPSLFDDELQQFLKLYKFQQHGTSDQL